MGTKGKNARSAEPKARRVLWCTFINNPHLTEKKSLETEFQQFSLHSWKMRPCKIFTHRLSSVHIVNGSRELIGLYSMCSIFDPQLTLNSHQRACIGALVMRDEKKSARTDPTIVICDATHVACNQGQRFLVITPESNRFKHIQSQQHALVSHIAWALVEFYFIHFPVSVWCTYERTGAGGTRPEEQNTNCRRTQNTHYWLPRNNNVNQPCFEFPCTFYYKYIWFRHQINMPCLDKTSVLFYCLHLENQIFLIIRWKISCWNILYERFFAHY
jgi:hypothetical protein